MLTHELRQGSPEWKAYRVEHDNASDAPAVLAASTYKTRDQLIAEFATGITPEFDDATQRLFDSGHRFEALARPLAEAIIGEDLYPCTGSLEGTRRSASFDGLTMLEDTAFEHKRLNARLRAALSVPGCTGADLPLEYQIQMEQQCEVSACEKVLFMASNWADDDTLIEELHCWYTPNLELRAKIVAGWDQFHKDVAAYITPAPSKPAAIAKIVAHLPVVLDMRVEGKLVACNLEQYKPAALAYIEAINTDLETDQDFADADADAKFCRDSSVKLLAAIEQALGQMGDVNSALSTVREIAQAFDAKGLSLEKSVKARKEELRGEIVAEGVTAYAAHIRSLNATLGASYMPTLPVDFGGAVKGKRTVESTRGAVNDELARAKIAASDVAGRIQTNLNHLREKASEHMFLFADIGQIVLKAADDLAMLVKSRLADHQAKEEALLETGRKLALEEAAEKPAPEPDSIAQPAIKYEAHTPVANVVPMRVAPAPVVASTLPSLKLGQIAERLGFTLTADFLKTLGFEPAATDRASKLYHEASFTHMCAALVRHIEAVQAQAAA